MRKYLLIITAVAALVAVSVAGVATAEKPVKVRAGNLELTFNGGFTPKALSKTKQTPIGIAVEGTIATIDGSHPPALKEFVVETDKNGEINVKGYPTCTAAKLQSQDSAHAKAICKSSIIGSGTTKVQIHAYITVPTPAAIVTTVKITKIHNGRYGTKSVASVTKIAGGSGSVTFFALKIDKKFNYKGKQVSVLTAKCTDGKLQAHGTAVFSDGTRASAEVIRTCTPKG